MICTNLKCFTAYPEILVKSFTPVRDVGYTELNYYYNEYPWQKTSARSSQNCYVWESDWIYAVKRRSYVSRLRSPAHLIYIYPICARMSRVLLRVSLRSWGSNQSYMIRPVPSHGGRCVEGAACCCRYVLISIAAVRVVHQDAAEQRGGVSRRDVRVPVLGTSIRLAFFSVYVALPAVSPLYS